MRSAQRIYEACEVFHERLRTVRRFRFPGTVLMPNRNPPEPLISPGVPSEATRCHLNDAGPSALIARARRPRARHQVKLFNIGCQAQGGSAIRLRKFMSDRSHFARAATLAPSEHNEPGQATTR